MPKALSAAELREQRRALGALSFHPPAGGALATLLLDKKASNFLTKLLAHLQDHPSPGPHDIRWLKDGRTLAVSDTVTFTNMVLPRLYKHSNFETFIRQMDIYGFSRCQPLTDGKLGERLWIHEKFDRHTPLSEAITFQRRAGPKSGAVRKRVLTPFNTASRKRVGPYAGWGGKRPGLGIVEDSTVLHAVSVEEEKPQPVSFGEEQHEGHGQQHVEGSFQHQVEIPIEAQQLVAFKEKVQEPVASQVEVEAEDSHPFVAVPLAFAHHESFAEFETASVISDVESTRSLISLSSFGSSRPSTPANLLGVSASFPRSRLVPTISAAEPLHVPYQRSISFTSPLASFAASRALRGTPLSISAPLASSFHQHRSPGIPSPLDPPSFPFPSQNRQLQSPPSSPRISIASEDSALRTPLGSHWELEGEVMGMQIDSGRGRRATVGSMDRMPGIYERLGSDGRERRVSGSSEGQNCYDPLSPPYASHYHSPPSPQYASASSLLFGQHCPPYQVQHASPPSPYYEPSSSSSAYTPNYPPPSAYQQARHADQSIHPRFASTSTSSRGFAFQVRRVQSSGNLGGKGSAREW